MNYRPYLRGVPIEELVNYIAEKEDKFSPEEKDDIKKQIEARIPKYISDDTSGIGLLSNGKVGFLPVHGSAVLDLTGDGISITEKGFMKYLHFVRFWWEDWGNLSSAVIGGSVVGVLLGIFWFFHSEVPQLLCRFFLKC